MKILVVTPWFPNSRADQHGNFILDSIESLIAEGHRVFVLVTRPWRPRIAGLFQSAWIKKQIQIKAFPHLSYLKSHAYISIPRGYGSALSAFSYRYFISPIIEKLLQDYSCDVIHAHTEIPGMAAVAVGKKWKIPTAITVHGISTERKLYQGKTRKILFETPLREANRVVLVGKPLLPFTQNFVPHQNHFRVVPNGFRLSPFNTSLLTEKKIHPHDVRFISVSLLEEGKGIELNLQALAKLKEQGITSWRYKIVGDGSERKKWEKLTHELQLQDHVVFVGACPHDTVFEHLSAANVFILPSYREAFGVAYVEAMSCGLLTLGVKGQGPQEYIEHGKTGLLVEPRDANDLAEKLKTIFLSTDTMNQIAEAGKKHVHAHFTWQHHAKALTHLYEEMISTYAN